MGFRKKSRNADKARWKVEKVGRDAAKIKRVAKGKTIGQKLADKMTRKT